MVESYSKTFPVCSPFEADYPPNLPHLEHVALSRTMCYNVPDLRRQDRKTDYLSINGRLRNHPFSPPNLSKKCPVFAHFGIQGLFIGDPFA